MILQCVPREEYNQLRSKYNRVLTTTSGLENGVRADDKGDLRMTHTLFQIANESIPDIVPDILPRSSIENSSSERADGLQIQLDHTKVSREISIKELIVIQRLFAIIEDQSAYYKGENESLRVEIREMKRLLEQCEMDSEPHALLGKGTTCTCSITVPIQFLRILIFCEC